MAAPCKTPGCPNPSRAKGHCVAHCAAERRNTPGSRRLGPKGGVMLPPLRLDPTLDLLMRAAVELEGVTLASWVRDAIGERVVRMGIKHPELAALGVAVLEE